MDLNEFLEEKLEKESSFLKNKEGKLLYLYHGTTRSFTKHSLEKNRTVLNEQYQGDWICYSADEDVAWDYASNSARNQSFEREAFLKDFKNYLDTSEMKDFTPYMYKAAIDLMDHGFEKGWDKTLKEFGESMNLSQDDAPSIFFRNIMKFESEKSSDDFYFDDFTDLLESVEYNKLNKGSQNLHQLFNQEIDKISITDIDFLKKLGFQESIPEPKVIKSLITANNILETSDRELAKNARENGYDLVIYSGEGTVQGKPEYLIANPSQISMQSVEIEKRIIERIGIGEMEYRIEKETKDLRKKSKNRM